CVTSSGVDADPKRIDLTPAEGPAFALGPAPMKSRVVAASNLAYPPGIGSVEIKVAMGHCQSLIAPSEPPVTMSLPSGAKQTLLTLRPSWAFQDPLTRPDRRSDTTAVPSREPDASNFPSGLKATQFTMLS